LHTHAGAFPFYPVAAAGIRTLPTNDAFGATDEQKPSVRQEQKKKPPEGGFFNPAQVSGRR
jgi:hypothetical protein